MNVDYGTSTLVIIAITIGVFIIIAINKYLNTPHLSPEEKIAHQVEAVYLFVKQNPNVRSSFVEAERDGATYVKTDGGDGIAFYRVHDGIYEKRIFSIPERPGIGKLGWVADWQKCKKLPPDVISISEIHVYSYY